MVTFDVSPTTLNEKARLIRTLLDESKSTHQQLWSQITTQVTTLPRDIAATHFGVNTPWNTALAAHYENHYQLTSTMGAAANAYENGDQDVKKYFDGF